MHEVFLTAVVADAATVMARSVLQGYCAMPEHHQLHRVMFYQGPEKPVGFKKLTEISRSSNAKLWSDLHQNLSRQSYMVQVRFKLDNEDISQ
jgi:mediator of RNA polymerase II transcription subunit 18